MAIDNALLEVRDRIHKAAIRAGRNPEEIKLVAVSKTVSIGRILEAVRSGVTILGENRVQEANNKISSLKSQISNVDVEWHLIGHLQKNKTKTAVQLFDLIHTVDSIALAEEVNRQAEKINKIQRILIQVKLSDESAKHGIPEQDLQPMLEKISQMSNLKFEGLMTMPPFFEDPEKTRPFFRRLRELKDYINASRITDHGLRDLSMGMSNDFEVAIEEGATMVRIGAAIFGKRN